MLLEDTLDYRECCGLCHFLQIHRQGRYQICRLRTGNLDTRPGKLRWNVSWCSGGCRAL